MSAPGESFNGIAVRPYRGKTYLYLNGRAIGEVWSPLPFDDVEEEEHDEARNRLARQLAASGELLEVAQHVVDSATIETPGGLLCMALAAIARAEGETDE